MDASMNTNYSHLDQPPPSHNTNPGDFAKSMARRQRANRLLREAQQLTDAARIASQYGCPSIENALTILAKKLTYESQSIQNGTKVVNPENVALKPQMQDKL